MGLYGCCFCARYKNAMIIMLNKNRFIAFEPCYCFVVNVNHNLSNIFNKIHLDTWTVALMTMCLLAGCC